MSNYIIAFDYNRYGYMPTYYSVGGMTYNKSKAKIFLDKISAQNALQKLIKTQNYKSVRELFGDIKDRTFSIIEYVEEGN